jgi:hypothetical protein
MVVDYSKSSLRVYLKKHSIQIGDYGWSQMKINYTQTPILMLKKVSYILRCIDEADNSPSIELVWICKSPSTLQ